MNINNRNTSQEFLEALESLKQARLITHSFMTHDHQFKGLTEAEQNDLQNSITPFFNAIFEIEDRILSWYREIHPELVDDDDLIESIEEELGYETLLSEKGKIDLEKLFKEDTEKSNQNWIQFSLKASSRAAAYEASSMHSVNSWKARFSRSTGVSEGGHSWDVLRE